MSIDITRFMGQPITVTPHFEHEGSCCTHIRSVTVAYDDNGPRQQTMSGVVALLFWHMWRIVAPNG